MRKPVDALPPLRYNGLVKWTRRIVGGVVLFLLFIVLIAVAINLNATSGDRRSIDLDEPSRAPTDYCGFPTPSPPIYQIACAPLN